MKPIFSLIITLLTILAAFQVYALVTPDSDLPGRQPPADTAQTDPVQPKSKSGSPEPVKLGTITKKITGRNLFKVQVSDELSKAPKPQNLPLEKTSLKLVLWGTVTGQKNQDGWAVIENLVNKQQLLYRVNDQVQGAAIKSILRNKVILTVDGKDQILEVNETSSPLSGQKRRRPGKSSRPRPVKNPRPGNTMQTADMPNKPAPSGQLFKTRPYVKNGEASGVMIYSIKKDSVARRMGLRNGDIILAVDDVEVQNPQDLEELDDSVDEHSDTTIAILRRGKAKELVFSGQDDAYSINDLEQ